MDTSYDNICQFVASAYLLDFARRSLASVTTHFKLSCEIIP